jgi:ribosome recycling factor
MIEELKKDILKRMEGALTHFKEELKGFRTGRANPAILEPVKVPYYGSPVPVSQVANITVPDPSLIVVSPWETAMAAEIDKAIRKADLGLNPVTDGKTVKVPIPALTEERRKELIKKAHGLAEAAKTAVRQVRRDGNEELKEYEKEGEISEDDMHYGLDEVQKFHDDYIKKIDETLKAKEKEILGQA